MNGNNCWIIPLAPLREADIIVGFCRFKILREVEKMVQLLFGSCYKNDAYVIGSTNINFRNHWIIFNDLTSQ